VSIPIGYRRPHPKFADANFDLPARGRLIRLAAFAIVSLFSLAACSTENSSSDGNLMAAIADRGSETICINQQNYQGCCSGKGGVRNIKGRQLECFNGDYSPSCRGEISTKLRGCCSHNEGIDYVTTDGSVYCINESQSKSCRIYLRACESV